MGLEFKKMLRRIHSNARRIHSVLRRIHSNLAEYTRITRVYSAPNTLESFVPVKLMTVSQKEAMECIQRRRIHSNRKSWDVRDAPCRAVPGSGGSVPCQISKTPAARQRRLPCSPLHCSMKVRMCNSIRTFCFFFEKLFLVLLGLAWWQEHTLPTEAFVTNTNKHS